MFKKLLIALVILGGFAMTTPSANAWGRQGYYYGAAPYRAYYRPYYAQPYYGSPYGSYYRGGYYGPANYGPANYGPANYGPVNYGNYYAPGVGVGVY